MTKLFSILFAVLVAFAVIAEESQPTSFEPLQGTWTITMGQQAGKPFNSIKGGMLTIVGRTFSLKAADGGQFNGELKLNTETTPKRMDFLLSTGVVWDAIYSVTDTTLRLNYVEHGTAERPFVFATTPSMAGILIMTRRTTVP